MWSLDTMFTCLPRYPIVSPRENCAGNLPSLPGVRSYGLRPASESYDVFCYAEPLQGDTQTDFETKP